MRLAPSRNSEKLTDTACHWVTVYSMETVRMLTDQNAKLLCAFS